MARQGRLQDLDRHELDDRVASQGLPYVALAAAAQPLQQPVAAQAVAGRQRRPVAVRAAAARSPLAQPLRRIRPEAARTQVDGSTIHVPVGSRGGADRPRPIQQPPEQGLQLHIRGDDHEVGPIVSCRGPGPRAKRGPDPVRYRARRAGPGPRAVGQAPGGRPKASAAHSRLGQAPAHRPSPATMLTGNHRHAVFGEVNRTNGWRIRRSRLRQRDAACMGWWRARPSGSASSDPRRSSESAGFGASRR